MRLRIVTCAGIIGLLELFSSSASIGRQSESDAGAGTQETQPSWRLEPEQRISIPGAVCVEPIWSPDGASLAIKTTDGLYLSSYPPNGKPDRICNSRAGRYLEARWSPSGKFLAIRPFPTKRGEDDELIVYDVNTRGMKVVAKGPGKRFRDFLWKGDDELFFRDEKSRSKDVQRARGLGKENSSPSSTFVWLEGRGGLLKLWIGDTDNNPAMEVGAPGNWWNPYVSPSGNLIAVATTADGKAARCIVMTTTGKIVHFFPPTFYVSEWSEDDRYILGYEQHVISGDLKDRVTASDIVVVDTRTWSYSRVQTEDMLEEHASWCLKTGKIAFASVGKDYISVANIIGGVGGER